MYISCQHLERYLYFVRFTLILYKSCKKLERYLYFAGFTLILYISWQQFQRYLFVFCWDSLGPLGPGGGEMWISSSWHWYCIYHANNWRDICILMDIWRDICILLGFYGPFGPWVWGDVNQFKFTLILYISCQHLEGYFYFVGFLWALWAQGMGGMIQFKFTLILYISCQQLERDLYFVGFTYILYISCQQLERYL